MQALLRQLNAVPGVVGSMVCDAEGHLVAHAFPPTLDPATLQRAAEAVGERTAALQAALGPVDMIDLRYTNSRIVVRVAERARVLFLCAPSINLQLLAMSAAGVLVQIDKLEAGAPGEAPLERGGGELHETVKRVEALIQQNGGDRVRLRGLIALKAGFTLDLIDADTRDDPVKLKSLRLAVSAVLGEDV